CLILTSLIFPFFQCPPSYRLITDKIYHVETLFICSEVYFFIGRVHVISTGPISTVQTEVKVFASS
ncbi:unnamed protein product, partial [Staurois parvus]